MKSQSDLSRFYDVMIRNLDFQLGFLTPEFQIPFSKLLTENMFENLHQFYSFKVLHVTNFTVITGKRLFFPRM